MAAAAAARLLIFIFHALPPKSLRLARFLHTALTGCKRSELPPGARGCTSITAPHRNFQPSHAGMTPPILHPAEYRPGSLYSPGISARYTAAPLPPADSGGVGALPTRYGIIRARTNRPVFSVGVLPVYRPAISMSTCSRMEIFRYCRRVTDKGAARSRLHRTISRRKCISCCQPPCR